MIIRPALTKDQLQILELLKTLDLSHHDQPLDNFWIADDNGKVVGVVRIEEFPDCCFISSLGIPETEQKKGIASKLLNHLFGLTKKNIYIYTIIPDFFKKFGFQPTSPHPSSSFIIPPLPSKSLLECSACYPNQCVTMVKLSCGA